MSRSASPSDAFFYSPNIISSSMTNNLDIIKTYFPSVTEDQMGLYDHLISQHIEISTRINLISRKDIDNIVPRHILHSLAIIKLKSFDTGTSLIDVGSGGGFPGIPMAIMLPDCNFTLIDSIRKKTDTLTHIRDSLGLDNVKVVRGRAEDHHDKYDVVLGRAVTSIPNFLKFVKGLIDYPSPKSTKGVLYLKGGEFEEELKQVKKRPIVHKLKDIYEDPFFETKYLLHFH